jgi:hypothetical protein
VIGEVHNGAVSALGKGGGGEQKDIQ